MQQPQPVIVLDIIPLERNALLTLLSGLSTVQWDTPTMCTGWSVKDLVAHLLGDDIGVLNMRDHPEQWLPQKEKITWQDLVVLINQLNQTWVEAASRISAPLIIDFLALTGEQTYQYFQGKDPHSLGRPVSWAGPEPAPIWLDIAREYTERWVHQQQIREALGLSGLTDPAFLSPVLNTFQRALPHTLREVDAPAGTAIGLQITGESGSNWALVKQENRWGLYQSAPDTPQAHVQMDEDTAWRLFTNSITKDQAAARCTLSGNQTLALHLLDAVAIIA